MYPEQYIDFVYGKHNALPQADLSAFGDKDNAIVCPAVKETNSRYLWGMVYFIFLGFVFLAASSSMHAQQEPNYAVHANIIYHFTKYIDWPASAKSGDFVIAVAGDTPLYDELKKNITNKMVGEQKIVVKKVSSSAPSFNCHILFISDDESGSIKKISSRTAGTPILLVAESEGLALKGAGINFIIVSDHLKLEINKNSIEERELHIASELLKLGKIVK